MLIQHWLTVQCHVITTYLNHRIVGEVFPSKIAKKEHFTSTAQAKCQEQLMSMAICESQFGRSLQAYQLGKHIFLKVVTVHFNQILLSLSQSLVMI